ncbi:metallophosphoesterase [Mucilaginibacter boryungensis]|uniref:Metallophosphoesterase n=1 Tax=Mucilaginibacter boryungensis TaxID=768480 RepID=A0ABR9XJR7_9SPHI|nr:metallophosphoesterase [Mucilaginibacter boryungensis]MBE9667475.1 metallophosphoesterase [Mucilaginibacter boryungensis]
MHGPAFLIFVAAILLLIDAYLLHGLRTALAKIAIIRKPYFNIFYWVFCVGMVTGLLCCVYFKLSVGFRASFMMFFFVAQVAKLCFLPFMLIDDIRRLIINLTSKKSKAQTRAEENTEGNLNISRSEFLMKAGIAATAIPVIGLGAGMASRIGIFDYHVKRVNLYLPNLPKKFDGLRLGQISDIHSGSFHKRDRVRIRGGVEMLMKEKPDLIFFTGDLVNDKASDIESVYDCFTGIKAPLGVFSCLGNHDYGDYSHLTGLPRQKNREHMLQIHKNYGWNLLLNENRRLKIEGEEIGILGVENWGKLSRFPKYGRMDQAVKNTDDLPVKLLLSHDPSHWRAEVVAKYPQIDAVFAGHTHGMQFGVQTERFQWSPIEYLYQEWAGLYREAHQQIYVNVGFGYVGYPGRIGILPEITIFTLKSAADPLSKNQA